MTESQTTPPPEPTDGADSGQGAPPPPAAAAPPAPASPPAGAPPAPDGLAGADLQAPPVPLTPPLAGTTGATPAAAPALRRRSDRLPPEPDASAPAGEDLSQAAADATDGPQAAPALDEGTYTRIREPRSSAALALDGHWHQISPRYVVSQFVQNGIFLAVVIAATLVAALAFDQTWAWIPGGLIVLFTLATLVVLPRQARAIGYMLRADDIVFRKGILWQRMIAVPYGRMQLVDITHGPLDRAFGVSQLKMVTAAATTGVQIPGLTQQASEALRDTLIAVAETRRTGL